MKTHNIRRNLATVLCSLGIIGLLSASTPQTAHAESNWSPAYTVSELELINTWFWLRLTGVSTYTVSGDTCTSTSGFVVDNDDGGFEQLHRTILAAFLSGRQIQVRVEQDPGGSHCRVTRLRLL